LATNDNLPSLPLELFDSLRAEDEERWLPAVFLPPPEFELMCGSRSVIIIGDEGSGKSALLQALQRKGRENLLVTWRPRLPISDNPEVVLREVLATCAVEIVNQATANAAPFNAGPGWATKEVARFVRRYITQEAIDRARADMDDSAYYQLQAHEPLPAYYTDLPDDETIRELVRALRKIGFAGVWVLSDTTTYRHPEQPDALEQALPRLLSTLSLFERGSFSFKVFISADNRFDLARAAAVNRRRIEAYRLRWSREGLVRLVEKRLAAALGERAQRLPQLCDDPELVNWLETYRDHNPRLWLESISLVVAAFLEHNPDPTVTPRPLPAQMWRQVRQRHPLPLTLDETGRTVSIGRHVVSLSPRPYQFIKYLSDNAGMFCSKTALFYHIHQGLDSIPTTRDDPNWVMPAKHSGPVDNMVWRLRNEIEPDPKIPVYIITQAGGVALFPWGVQPPEED
jgi:hypothetical protein